MDSLAAEVATAESIVERLAVEEREEVSHWYCHVKRLDTISSLEFPRVPLGEERKQASTECYISPPA